MIRKTATAAFALALAICWCSSPTLAQNETGTWVLQKITEVREWPKVSGSEGSNTRTWQVDKRTFEMGWTTTFTTARKGDRTVTFGYTLTKFKETFKHDDFLSFDVKVFATLSGVGGFDSLIAQCEEEATTVSGIVERGFDFSQYQVAKDKRSEFGCGVRNTNMPKEDFTDRFTLKVRDPVDGQEKGELTILLHYRWTAGDRAAPSGNGTLPLSGKWEGSYVNSKNESGSSTITITEAGNGTITGDEGGWKIENARRMNNTITWEYRNQNNGCRDYLVTMQLSSDGKVLSGSYTVTDRCARPGQYTGEYIRYTKQ